MAVYNLRLRLGALLSASVTTLLLMGCGSKDQPTAVAESAKLSAEVAAPAATKAAPKAAQTTDRFAEVRKLLEADQFDHAAARLLEMRASGKEFTAQEAADYRETLEEAYGKALEAREKKDPRGAATLQMIKAVQGQ
jgi:hypothetical protein